MDGLLNDPRFLMGAGLLSGSSPGGSLAQGIQAGLQNTMLAKQFGLQQQLQQKKLDDINRQQQQREQQQQAFNALRGQPARISQVQPGSAQEFAEFDQPNYAGDVSGGLLMDQAPTGMYAKNPQMAQIMSLLGPEAGAQLLAKQLQPQEATTAMRNYEYLVSQGVPQDQAQQQAFGKMTINVGNGPMEPPKNFMWETPQNPQATGFAVKPIPGGPADPEQASASDRAKKYREGQAKLGSVRQAITNYQNKLSQYGGEVMPGEGKAELASSYRDLQLELKELYNLGVLNGPDLMLMEQVLTNPTSLSGATYQGVGSMFGADPLGSQLNVVIQKLTDAENRNRQLYGPDQARFTETVGE